METCDKRFMTENIGKLIDIEANNGERFQKQLAKFAMENGFKKIVETGCGVSSVFMLYEMMHTKDMEDAMLYSIDTKPWYPHEIVSPQHELILAKSIDALLPLFIRLRSFDLLLHDGNHNTLDMCYDLEFGYACLRSGGVIACDDYSWGNGNVFDKFAKRHNLDVKYMGDIAYAFKEHGEHLTVSEAGWFSDTCLEMARSAEKEFLESGGVNHPAFV